MTPMISKGWLGFVCAIAVAAQISCKKVSPISVDNDNEIQTPYGLFVANSNGMLLNTHDGKTFFNVFPPDGYAPVALESGGENLLMLKNNLHVSLNNGKNFQVAYERVNKMPWEEQLVYVPGQNRVYVTSQDGQGVAYSADKGESFVVEDQFNELIPYEYEITSFAYTNDGAAFAFSNLSYLLLKKDNAGAIWNPVTIEGSFPSMDGYYFLSGNGQNLFLVDHLGRYPHYISENGGTYWRRLRNDYIPYNAQVNAVCQAPGGPMVIGTENAGVFVSDEEGFMVGANGGMYPDTKIRRLSVKKNAYKNGGIHYYIFAATDKGLYRSDDKGYNWILMTDTTAVHNYTSMR